MSNLRKTLRALQHCEEWREILEAACILQGVESTQDLQVRVTNSLADDILLDENTLEVDVSGITDADVIDAVTAYVPPEEPEPSVVEELAGRIEQLSERVESITAATLDPAGITVSPSAVEAKNLLTDR